MTVANLRIITPNDADDATLSATPALVAALPQANLQDVSRAKVARTTSLAAQDIKGTWATPRTISAAAIVRHNLTSDGTWRLRLYSDAAWTTLVYDSGVVVACPPKALGDLEWGVDPLGANLFTDWALAFSSMFFNAAVAQSFTLSIADAGNPDTYMEISRLCVGRTLEPLYNFDWGFSLSWQEQTTQQRTEGGTLRSDGAEPYRRLAFRVANLSASDRPKFTEYLRKAGMRSDAFVSMFPNDGTSLERDHAMSAKLVQASPLAGDFVNNFMADFVMEEA